ncbi:Crp/Fnr family transcriptional regulator [Qipengyuania spongiae]|uniref:Crp/Fnr family transcriptional regulator n=1 Tax=Qipengyuania spongiae TaxID=2909673 RepID=A0ABY5SYK5_9SPHN|nr:Crp/Fnr family transcriptional regulator [Qipengyuania spongiae]UVI38161.1 Crp/Fnr family transcriptional regulator [Qipengyuania spongiae]
MKTRSLLRKLRNVTVLTREEAGALEDSIMRIERFHAGFDIISEGSKPNAVHLMVSGWAARRKMLENGANQFTAFLIPGDFCDIHVTVLARMDHNITAITNCEIAMIDGERLDELASRSSNLARALWWTTLVDEAVLREWVVNNGQRRAYAAVAHLLCEMHVRLCLVGEADGSSEPFTFPVTQEHIANATGLTPVHVNRTLQQLRGDGLIRLHSRQLGILDLERLRAVAGFEIEYLHLMPRGAGDEGIER